MSKNYKIKHQKQDEKIIEDNNNLSKKELYDLKKKNKLKIKEKEQKKEKKKGKKHQTNLIGRIFAIVMLLLMLGSIVATISYSFR